MTLLHQLSTKEALHGLYLYISKPQPGVGLRILLKYVLCTNFGCDWSAGKVALEILGSRPNDRLNVGRMNEVMARNQ